MVDFYNSQVDAFTRAHPNASALSSSGRANLPYDRFGLWK